MKHWSVTTIAGEKNLQELLDEISGNGAHVFSVFRWIGPLGQENYTVVSYKQEAE